MIGGEGGDVIYGQNSPDPPAAAPGRGEPSQLMHKRLGPQKDVCCLTLKVANAKAKQAKRDKWSGVYS